MGIKSIGRKIPDLIKKYKYIAIILIIGIVLMTIPNTSEQSSKESKVKSNENIYKETLDQTLISLLSKVDGAGKVEVMLTVAIGEQTVYQVNTDQTTSDQTTDIKSNTVVLSDSSRNEYGMVVRVDPPKYQGAVVLCQGADSPVVRLAVIEAVSKVTGLGSDRICVLKMK